MRFVRFDGGRLGALDGDDVVDITSLVGADTAGRGGALHDALQTGLHRLSPDGLDAQPRRPLSDVTLQAPLPRPGKIVAAPVNYVEHKEEMNEDLTVASLGVFLKAPTSVIGPGENIELPYLNARVDQEGELAVVIGSEARHVSVENALDYVFGYTCLLDITHRSTEDRSTRKSFDTFTPLGPWVVTADEVGDPAALRLRCWVGDELRQDVATADLIFDVRLLIAYASSVMTLEVGDVITTGTPAGVGPIVHGDRLVVEIDRVGRLEVSVRQSDHAVPYPARVGANTSGRPARA